MLQRLYVKRLLHEVKEIKRGERVGEFADNPATALPTGVRLQDADVLKSQSLSDGKVYPALGVVKVGVSGIYGDAR